ncbi:tRNA (adenosine(37)-N6)-threonylcarbamoyltransferase complex ATPase subunit type 1 TsaE [Anaerococcus tetradius]|uniref:tRNA (adenosine(37)-N6)-threonylcarbamoyltransferase complex ATPase subunit type 1 TsaE n=1 Tax=Anaerococcus tetradius TaxID=33036 RepID=UPI0023F39900|nr:tRNA (adenosine(37)-N6)-threonylcarbamoyltransferase complex ATPase subunit type 1 TsaE [Anaerococcus tetradius]
MIIKNLEELKNFADKFASLLKEGDVVNLIGDMGAGKTTLTGYICKYFHIDDSSSPTFAIVNIYDGDKKIYHLDLYRFDHPDDVLDIDFEEYFYPQDAITILEWAENVEGYLPNDMINLEIKKMDETSRQLIIDKDTPRGSEINEYFSN